MTRARGFTLIELVVTLAITAVLGGLAYSSLERMRPRATLAGTAADLAGLFYNARQNALATGHHTVVMIFPNEPSARRGVGRAVAYEDASYQFFNGASGVNFGTISAARADTAALGNLLGSVELPPQLTIGLGGAPAPTLAAPYASVTASDCNFCKTSGDRRGAVVFDARGSARFFSGNGAPQALPAGTLALTFADVPGYSMLVITPSTGAVRPYAHR